MTASSAAAAGNGRTTAWRLVLTVSLSVAGILMLLPVVWVVINSIEPESLQFKLPPVWIPSTLSATSYQQLFSLIPFAQQIVNSLLVSASVVIGSTLISTLAAYAFARLEFPGKNLLFLLFMAGLMLPVQLAAVPEFVEVRYLGLLNSRLSLVIPALIQVFGIFLLRQHFKTIPRELEDAARIDGAGELQILRHVIIPLSWPALSAVAIVTGQYIWNDFFWPLLFINDPTKMTAPLGLATLENSYLGGPVAAVFGGLSVLVVPAILFFVLVQRRLMEGIGFAGIAR
jgi:multiple sugar transport system permease protein